MGGITPYTGIDTTNPIDSFASNSGFGITATTSSITASVANDEIVSLFATDVAKAFTVPTGMTEKYDLSHAPLGPDTAADDALQVTAGTVPSVSSTLTGNKPRYWSTQQIALRSAPATTLNNGLVAYWKLDESSGDAVDATGNGYTLTNHDNGTYTPALINNGYDTGANNTYTYLANTGSLGYNGGPWSVNIWLKAKVLSNEPFFFNIGDAYSNTNLRLRVYNGSLYFTRADAGVSEVNITSTHIPSATVFEMYTLTFDGTTMSAYVNGTLVGSALAGGSGVQGDIGTSLMALPNGGYPTSGVMDEAGMWSRGLTASEVSQLYNSGTGRPYFNF